MTHTQDLENQVTPGVNSLVKLATEIQKRYKHDTLRNLHWLEAILERHPQMAASLAGWGSTAEVLRETANRLTSGDAGEVLSVENLLQQAIQCGKERGKQRASEPEVVEMVLGRCGHKLVERPPDTAPGEGTAKTMQHAHTIAGDTPVLDRFGRDLTAQAREDTLAPVVERDSETDQVIETLCRVTKGNPVLLGPAGVGKTAVVEGLAIRIVKGDVPERLRNCRVIALQPSVLTAGASVVGELEKRMQAIVNEARQQGIILFIDEIHSIMGAGGMHGLSDIASQLKPYLARGEIRCIGATTSNEYRVYIERDEALERRFQPVRIQELNKTGTLAALRSVRENLKQKTSVEVPDDILPWLIEFADDYLKNRYFPDKAIDLLEQCVAHALAQGRTVVDRATAEEVSQRLLGIPLGVTERIEELIRRLQDVGVATGDEIRALTELLPLSMRGLDVRPQRPAAVVLLLGQAALHCERLAQTIASALFGSEERVVDIDLSGYTHWSDTHRLIGSGAGYIGYSDQLPIHGLIQMPFSVLLIRSIDQCNHAVRDLITQSISSGCLTDGMGRKIYLSDAVVLLTSHIDHEHTSSSLGFRNASPEQIHSGIPRDRLVDALGEQLSHEVDAVFSGEPEAREEASGGPYRMLLDEMAARYREKGLHLTFDDSALAWMASEARQHEGGVREWERSVEHQISRLISPMLSDSQAPADSIELCVSFSDNRLKIDRKEG